MPEWAEDEEDTDNLVKPFFEMKSAMSTMTPIIEEDSGVDSLSNFSTNERNFQMPEKDFILEINKQKGESKMLNIDDEEELLGYKYVYQTKLTKDTVNERIRSPMRMWSVKETYIDNNLQHVLNRLHEYYDA